ncbi:hemerythrin domain-containing protein [Thiorhodovibrio litoralis]|nr:hemerythrin domain-containing protein [Thiorhodovibrio litoralis]WPL11922.1 iron-sulfur cluster repair di-iron protein [Thiorhodovibrio litoralis]
MSQPFVTTLTADHRRCDQLFVQVETAAQSADWTLAASAVEAFCNATDRHFQFEEDMLFPPLEEVMPGATGPTAVMRQEHQLIRQLMGDLRAAVDAQDGDESLGVISTLHMVLQQHNIKEEGVLYPAADRDLADQAERLLASLA